MELDRLTPATHFKINSPIWNGGKRVVGLDIKRITKHNIIEITYRRKSDGELSFPDQFYFDGDLLNEVDYKRMNVKTVTLVLIPFNDLKTVRRV